MKYKLVVSSHTIKLKRHIGVECNNIECVEVTHHANGQTMILGWHTHKSTFVGYCPHNNPPMQPNSYGGLLIEDQPSFHKTSKR